MEFKMGKLCSFILFIFTIALVKKGDGGVVDCPSDGRCEKISPDPDTAPGIYTACEDSERGNDKSRKVCTTVYVMDASQSTSATATNPNPDLCTIRTTSDKAVAACNNYIKTRSPFTGYVDGVKYTHCYTSSTPYICEYKKKSYILCSVQAVVCQDKCGSGLVNYQ